MANRARRVGCVGLLGVGGLALLTALFGSLVGDRPMAYVTPTLPAPSATRFTAPTPKPEPIELTREAAWAETRAAPAGTATSAPVEPTADPSLLSVASVLVASLNLRQGPDSNTSIIGQVRQGDALIVLDANQAGTWLYVQTRDGFTGWVAAEYVSQSAPPATSVPTVQPTARQVAPLATPERTEEPTPSQPEIVRAQVVEVTDGDTIDVRIGGDTYAVRYIGVDSPELSRFGQLDQPYGLEATAKNRELVEGRIVQLEKDVSETDQFGRLLRYVWVGDVMVNAEMVRQGYASAATFPPDVKYQELFARLNRDAREAGRGMWAITEPRTNASANLRAGPGTNYALVEGLTADRPLELVARNPAGDWLKLASGLWIAAFLVDNVPDLPVAAEIPPPPTATPRPPTATPPPPTATPLPQPAERFAPPVQACDPCYPDICIPANSPDLDCGEIPYCRFRVLCDPHGFDRDNDGMGCEVCR